MNTLNRDMTLGFYNESGLFTIPATQHDTGRTLTISLVNNGEEYQIPETVTAHIKLLKPDGYQVNNICTIENNTIIILLSAQMLAVPGTAQCELYLTDGESKLTTSRFNLFVAESVHDDSQIESTYECDYLDELLSRAQETVDNANSTVNKLQNELIFTENINIPNGVVGLDENCKISNAQLPEATTTSKGITQLSDSVLDTSVTTAATSNSVKQTYDKILSVEATLSDTVSNLKNIAFSGNYNDLSDLPTIPTKMSELTNDSAYITEEAFENIVVGIKGNNETEYRTGKVNLTAEDVGALAADATAVAALKATQDSNGNNIVDTYTPQSITSSLSSELKSKRIFHASSCSSYLLKLTNFATEAVYYVATFDSLDEIKDGDILIFSCTPSYTGSYPLRYIDIRTTISGNEISLGKYILKHDNITDYTHICYISNKKQTYFNISLNGSATAINYSQILANEIYEVSVRADKSPKLIERGSVTGDTVTLSLDQKSTYVLYTRTITVSTGKIYGAKVVIISVNSETDTTTKVTAGNDYASTNAGYTQTLGVNEYSITTAAAYQTFYELYKM